VKRSPANNSVSKLQSSKVYRDAQGYTEKQTFYHMSAQTGKQTLPRIENV
jgi:hypothetical protein